jgi:alanyl-tRNA synthetase
MEAISSMDESTGRVRSHAAAAASTAQQVAEDAAHGSVALRETLAFLGDQGILREPGGGSPLVDVLDTQKPAGGLFVHRGRLHGRLKVGETVDAVVDAERRARTMRNHTGTHLLHRALRNIVGPQARQAGSLVAPEYLRFDFPLDRPVTEDEKRAIEAEVRRIVREDRPLAVMLMPMAEAIEAGADAFFDE